MSHLLLFMVICLYDQCDRSEARGILLVYYILICIKVLQKGYDSSAYLS